MEPHRGWTIASSSWNFLQKRWLHREQELITVIQEETQRTQENEEAGYRSPTWSILRALQEINKGKRLEGEAEMSAPSFFQLAGRGYVKFWGEDDGPTVVVKNSREKWRKFISVTGSLRGQAQVRPIDKLDEACTNADDRMMLVQHRCGDRVMS